MKTSDFDYVLPEELMRRRRWSRGITAADGGAQGDGRVRAQAFLRHCGLFTRGDALVINETKVIPARLLGVKDDTGVRWRSCCCGG
jgi:S-adenosylmethionine:tRNA ribosyltransferase-isomerase